MALPIDVTDPGSVNAGDFAPGLGVPKQVVAFDESPAGPAGLSTRNVEPGNGPVTSRRPLSVDQAIDVETPFGRGIIAEVDGDASLGPGRGAATDINPGDVVANQAPGLGITADVDGDASRGPNGSSRSTITTSQNTVVGQVYGSGGLPANVNV